MKRRMSFISEEELADAGPEGVVEDEGYSEDPLSRINRPQPRAGSVISMRRPSQLEPEALINSSIKLDVDDRRSIILRLLQSMPASMVQNIVNAMYPILHISFLERLPPEVCLKILGLLDPYDLISLAQCSKQASSLSYDWTLWQNLYYREGFLANQKELRKFEQELKESNERERVARQQQLRSRPSTSDSTHAPPKKRSRPTPGDYEVAEVETIEVDPGYVKKASLFNNASSVSSPISSSSTSRYDVDGSGDQQVLSPSAMSPLSPASFQRHESTGSSNGRDLELPPLASSLTTTDRLTKARKLNWQFLYTQRRRLEQNWANDRYTNYQIPHPDYPEEAHTDAIYSIQQDGTHVVTASRDNTVRIWDLNTQRLLRILRGHRRSVLCVQFDASPDEDVVMSGSSDGTVRIYKFSTGVCTNIIPKAHDESVLNLKFNKHILVTCSKDKTLKIFNRKQLFPGELGYRVPADFVYKPVPQTVNYPGMVPNPYGDLPVKEPYSVIGYLEGHGAAVNYCVIRGNEVVSASGDRLAKVWDWPTGVCTRSLIGHTKGVACVVYDGRRVVTGSSDCEIKVFDRQTGVEVAALKGPGGHTGLVRTVQAGFADAGNEAELREEDRRRAWMVDRNFFSSLSERPDYERAKWAMDQRSRSAGNAGSERPEDIICYGAALPPGGGGSKYGRIISGSYDENVIVWRKDGGGAWKPKSVLKPADAMRSALLQHELSLPEPGRRPDLLQPILDSLGQPTDTSAWRRAFIEALLDSGPDVLRAGLAAYPMLMHHAPRLIAMIRVIGGTRDAGNGDGARRLIPGGMVVKGRLRAIVHAAMWREMRALTGKLVRWGGEEKLFKKWVGDASRSINLAERALERVLEGHEEPLTEGDTVWKQRMIHYQMQAPKRPTISSTSHGAGIIQPTEHRRIANPIFSSPSPDPAEQSLEQQISTYLATETSYLSQWRKHLKDLEDLKDATRNHHVVLSRMLHEVEPRGRRVTGTLGLGGVDPNINIPAVGGAGGVGAGGAATGAAAEINGAEQGDGGAPAGADEAETSWEGKVYNLRFDARRIVCASSNPIILIWDFACGDREIECASRFFKGVGCEK